MSQIFILFKLFLLFITAEFARSNHTDEQCKGNTKCVPLPTCVPYMNLIVNLDKPLHKNLVSFLKAQECGFGNEYPNVCCKMLPSKLRVLKHITPTKPEGPEMLHIPLPTIETKKPFSPTKRDVPAKTQIAVAKPGLKNDYWKYREINSGFFDIYESLDVFDLFRKRRGAQKLDVDVEIR